MSEEVQSVSAPLPLAIYARKFWTESRLGPNGEVVYSDFVTWANKGASAQTAPATTEKVARMPSYFPDEWRVLKPAYDAWKSGKGEAIDGTPLEAVAFISQEHAEGLRLLGIRTVEDLASANDASIGRIGMGGMGMREKARVFLRSRTGDSEKDKQIAELKAQMAEMQSLVAGLTAEENVRRGPGRPRKE